MNINDVAKIIQTTGLLNQSYSVGLERENQLILMREGKNWLIYHFERGERDIMGEFEDEDEACRFYINKVADNVRSNEAFLRRMAREDKP